MAFLNFIFKDKQGADDDPDGEASSVPAADTEEVAVGDEQTEALAEQPPVEDPADIAPEAAAEHGPEELGAADEMDLDQLVEALQLISEFLGEEEEEEEDQAEKDLKNAVSIPFTLEQVSDLMTDAFDKKAVAKTDTSKMVHIVIEDVFAQLGQGKVTAPVSRVVAEVPPELLVKGFDRFSENEVSLPLQLVVAAVQPGDLESRSADQDSGPDLESMPDLFASGSGPVEAPSDTTAAEHAPAPDIDNMADPFSMAGPPAASEPEVQAPDGDTGSLEEGALKFELNEDANIFNFAASPVEESAEATEEVVPEPEPPVEAIEAEDRPAPDPALVEAETVDERTAPEPADEPEPVAVDQDEDQGATVEEEMEEPEPADATGEIFGPTVIDPSFQVGEPAVGDEEALVSRGDGEVLLSGLDLNAADAQDMSSRLDGVGPRLAARIVRHREVNGPFRSTADLARVQGVGPSTYRKMTGQSWSEARDSLKRTLDYVLGSENQGVPDLKAVARRIHSLSGFEGCVFAHSDGHMLAASWDDEKQDALGAIAPQMLKKLAPYVEELDVGDLNPLTLRLSDTSICVLQSGHIVMSTVHRSSGLGRRQIRLIELLGSELEQRLEVSVQF